MGVRVNGQYYLSEITDYLTPAEKAAKEAKAREERAHQDRIAHSKNIYDTDKGMQQLAAVKSLATLSATVAKGVSQGKKAREQKKAEEQTATNQKLTFLTSNPTHKDGFRTALEWNEKAKGINEQDQTFKSFVEGLRAEDKLSDELARYLLKSSSGELLRAKLWQGSDIVNNFETTYKDDINNLRGKDRVDHAAEFNTPEKVQHDYRTKLNTALTALGLDEDTIISNFATSIQSSSEKVKTAASLLYSTEGKFEEAISFEQGLEKARTVQKEGILNPIKGPVPDPRLDEVSVFVNQQLDTFTALYTEKGMKPEQARQMAKQRVTALIKMSVIRKEFNQADLGDLKKGLNLGNHPAGKHGDVLLSQDQFKEIEIAINNTNIQLKAQHEVGVTKMLNEGLGLAVANKLTVDQHSDLILKLDQLGVDKNSKEYKQLLNYNPDAQSATYYKKEQEQFWSTIKLGRTKNLKAQITNIKNNQLRSELEQLHDRITVSKDQNNWPVTYKDVARSMVVEKGKLTINPGVELQGNVLGVRNHIANLADGFYMYEMSRSEPGDTEVGARALVKLNAKLDELGFNVTKEDDPRAGILTPGTRGQYNRFGVHTNVQAELGRSGGDFSQKARKIVSLFNDPQGTGVNTKQRVLTSPGLLTNIELLAVSKNTQLNNLTSWPRDVLSTAEMLGVAPSELVRAQLKALIASPDKADKKFVQTYQLDKFLDKIPTVDVEVRKLLEQSGNKNLLSKYEHYGLRSFHPGDYETLVGIEQGVEKLGQKETKEAQEVKAKESRITRIKELFGKDFKIKPSLLKTLLESDEALDKFITEQGLLESK